MTRIDRMKWGLILNHDVTFPLVTRKGSAKVVEATETSVDLLVEGRRADYTWDRVHAAWERLNANHELSVAELGGQYDAVGLVSLLAFIEPGAVDVYPDLGLLRLRHASGTPVHQPTAPRT